MTGNSTVTGNGTVTGRMGIGTSTPAAKLDIQGGADANGAGDPGALAFGYRTSGYRHFVSSRHNSGTGGNALDFYLNNSITTAGSSAPGTGNTRVLTLDNNGGPRVGIGTNAPTQALDVVGNATVSGNVGIGTGGAAPRGNFDVAGTGNSYLVTNVSNGNGQSLFLPGHLWLAPFVGTSGTAFVQARVPGPSAITSIGLTFRTTNAGSLVDALVINANGSASFAGPVTATSFSPSDVRLKEHIRPLTGALAAVQGLRGVRYSYRRNLPGKTLPGGEQVGVLAQEVEALYPELVSTGADGYKAVNYAQLTPVLIEAIKELKAENDALKARAATSEANAAATTEAFEARLRALEAGGGQARK